MDIQDLINKLLPVIQNVVGGILKSSDSGIIGKFREVGSVGEFLKEAAEEFEGNELIGGLLSGLKDFDLNIDLDNLDPAAVLDNLGGLDDLLGGLGDEASDVKGFILRLAEKIAGAAGGGLFGTGDKISASEQQFLTDLKSKLGL